MGEHTFTTGDKNMNHDIPTFTWAGALMPQKPDFTLRQHVTAIAAGLALSVAMATVFVMNL
jgi:hypothetical protein